jgi:hypothetical protein
MNLLEEASIESNRICKARQINRAYQGSVFEKRRLSFHPSKLSKKIERKSKFYFDILFEWAARRSAWEKWLEILEI